ncbi:tetratricopeptide repeat-containing S1 family peptidase [Mesoterricola sediminis]|uniref:Tetratricopeptide repeat protein n=1 Tax=Mesoterricola sediminis TaxID=2927980 RepID=A0AA48KBH7_9BACT|nr:tetratricopeptide repeat-containing serine protease family protein [Mesoterricola sediminis]BDU75095.1 hypothetical protein METESE_00530 [Mesoterricola sediminis]
MRLPWILALSASVLLAQPAPGPASPQPAPLDRMARSLVRIRAEVAPGRYQQGSGVVVASGQVVTNAHVVKNAYRIVAFQGDRVWEASALCIAPDRDLVILRLPGLLLPVAEPAPAERVRAGEAVVAVGFGGGPVLGQERGRITALWSFRGSHLIQTNTRNRPGSSGGGLFTEDGYLLGITTFNVPVAEAMDFAVPADWVLSLVRGRGEDAPLACPAIVEDRLLMDFTDLMGEDPRNQAHWEALTRAWVAGSPRDAAGWYARGTALDTRYRAHPEDAALLGAVMEAYQRAVDLDPRYTKAWNNLGSALDSLNRFAEAQTAFRRALAARPDYGLAWLNLGASLLNSGRLQEAIPALEQGLALQGDHAESWARLAYCEASLGRGKAAVAHYRVALRYAPYRLEWWADIRRVSLQAGDKATAKEAEGHLRLRSPSQNGTGS